MGKKGALCDIRRNKCGKTENRWDKRGQLHVKKASQYTPSLYYLFII